MTATRPSLPNQKHSRWLLLATLLAACGTDAEWAVSQRYVREVCSCGDWSCADAAQQRFDAARPGTASTVVAQALRTGSACRARLAGPRSAPLGVITPPPSPSPGVPAPPSSAPPADAVAVPAPTLDGASQKAFLRARKAAKNRSYDEALIYYTEALSRGTNDALCLGERGYVRLRVGDLDGALEDLWYAAGAAGDHHTYAQIWFNLGLA